MNRSHAVSARRFQSCSFAKTTRSSFAILEVSVTSKGIRNRTTREGESRVGRSNFSSMKHLKKNVNIEV